MDFLEDWDAFVQKLLNIFGSYSPEDDDEDAIIAIPFLPDSKVVTYFIQFAKYKNRIWWNDRSLRKVVKNAIPARISEELCFSKEDLFTFEGYKQAVLKINNDHWKQVQEEKNRQRLAHTLQDHLQRVSRPEPPKNLSEDKPPALDRQLKNWGQPLNSHNPTQPSTTPATPPMSILGPNG